MVVNQSFDSRGFQIASFVLQVIPSGTADSLMPGTEWQQDSCRSVVHSKTRGHHVSWPLVIDSMFVRLVRLRVRC